MFCVIEIYRYSYHSPTKAVVNTKGCVFVCGESESECARLIRVLVWIVKAPVNKYISRRQKKELLAIRTKREHILYSLLLQHCQKQISFPQIESKHPPDHSILEVFGAVLCSRCM